MPKKFLLIVLPVFTAYAFCSCFSAEQKDNSSPGDYNLLHPVVITLPHRLDEISGIIYNAKDSSVFAINDATGILYEIALADNNEIKEWKFGSNHDYEDLYNVNGTFYILASNGDLVNVKINDDEITTLNEFTFSEKGNFEFEGLYYDDDLKKLMLLCKDCKEDNKNKTGIWSFDPAINNYDKAPYSISTKTIAEDLDEKKIKFHPSAATIHPLTHQLYILSSVNKVLVTADKTGNVINVYHLDPSVFKQPEGITFTPSGDMLISNESADKGKANILFFKHHTQ